MNFEKRTIFAFNSFHWTYFTKSIQAQKSALVRLSSSFHFFIKTCKKVGYGPMNRVFVRRSDLKSGSEILTGKFLAYMTQIEARIFRKAWIQHLDSFSQFGVRKFDVENSTFLDAFQIEKADCSWKIRYHDHFAFFRNAVQLLHPFFENESKILPPIFFLGENSIFWGILKRTFYKVTGLAKIYRKFLWKLLYGFGSQNEVKKYINKFSRLELSSIHALDF